MDLAPGEVVLVSCHATPRRRVSFDVTLTDRRLIWERSTVWSLRGRVTESHPVGEISEVGLTRRRPYFMWLLAALLSVLFLFVIAEGAFKQDWYGMLLFAAGIVLVIGAGRTRHRLSWRRGRKRYAIVTPYGDMQKLMHEALAEIRRLLADENARVLEVRRIQMAEEAERDEALSADDEA